MTIEKEINIDDEIPQIKNKESWEGFVKGEVLNFLIQHNLQSITIDDGTGKKGAIKVTSTGDYKVQITSNETL